MTSIQPRTIIIPLCDWYWFTPLAIRNGEFDDILERVKAFRKAGHTILQERSKIDHVYTRYVVAFHTEEEAALFKLSNP